MNGATRSGDGWRMTMVAHGEPVVSIWARTPDDAEYMAHRDNLEHMRAMEEERVRMEREFHAQAVAEFRKIRARA